MKELYSNIQKSRLPQFFFYAGLTVELLIVIVNKSSFHNPIESQLFRVTFLLFALKLLFTDYSLKGWGVIALFEAVAFVSYRATGGNDLIRLVTFVAACRDIPVRQMLKYTFGVTLAGCLLIVTLSVAGIYGDISLTQYYGHEAPELTLFADREGTPETRYTLGMGHPNALACMSLMLTVLGVYLWFNRLKWYGYVLLLLLDAGVWKLTDSKTGTLITAAFLAGAFMLHCCRFLREKAFVYVCGLLVFAMCLGFSLDVAVCAPRVWQARWNLVHYSDPLDNGHIFALERIDRVLTGRIVALAGTVNNEGTVGTWSLFSKPHNREYYFDMGWVRLFYWYGIVPGTLYIAAMLALLWGIYKKRDACGLLAFATLVGYTVIEAHLISVYLGRNYLLMLMGYYLTQKDLPQEIGHKD